MSQLAQELIDYIIDTIASDALSNDLWPGSHLLQCSLTARCFRPRSQRHIFSHIQIRGASPSARRRKVEQLAALIHANPSLASCIDELSLESLELTGACPIPVDERTFISVMERISPLRTLKLAVASVRDLENPGRSLNNFFLPFIAPFITSLDLRHLGSVPIEAITNCKRLTSLGLSLVDFAQCDQPSSSCSGLKLKHLTHWKSKNALDTLLRLQSHVDLSQLKSFTAYTDDNSVDQIQSVLDLTADSLEELHLLSMDDTAWVALYQSTPTLAPLTKLHSLHLHIPFCPISINVQSSLRLLLNILSSIRTGSLRTLSIEAKVGFIYFPVADDPEVLLQADWRAVCEEIARVMDSGGTGAGVGTCAGIKEERREKRERQKERETETETETETDPPTFEFKLTYRHLIPANQPTAAQEAERVSLQTRCQRVMALLHQQHFDVLVNPYPKDKIGDAEGRRRGRGIRLVSPVNARLVRDVDDDFPGVGLVGVGGDVGST